MPNNLTIFLFDFFSYTYIYIIVDIPKLFLAFYICLLIVLYDCKIIVSIVFWKKNIYI